MNPHSPSHAEKPEPLPLRPAEHYFATVAPDALERPQPPRGPVPPRPAPSRIWQQLVSDDAAARSDPRLLPPLAAPEPIVKRLLFLTLALAIAVGFLYLNLCYWAPAHPGVDQNGYLVGGRMLAEHGSTGYQPREPFAFVGAMWVGVRLDTPTPEYFPKYPIGLPALYALCLKLGPAYASVRPHLLTLPVIRNLPLWVGRPDGTTLAYLVSPICMTLAVWAMFLLGRLVAGSFSGIVAMVLLATCQVVLGLADNPNSHASALCFVTFGIYFILKWWMTGVLWRGLLGGFLAGYAVTIRYTEGLLVLPIAVAMISSWRLARPRSIALPAIIVLTLIPPALLAGSIVAAYPLPHVPAQNAIVAVAVAFALVAIAFWVRLRTVLPSVAVGLAWAVPVGILVWFNLHHIGHMTGYDPTNESEGFSWKEFLHKWEFTAQQVYDHGVFFITPLAILGMALMYRQSKRLGLFMTAWFLPIALLYTSYYWGGNIRGLGFLRFFVTLFPAMILPAVWLIHTAGQNARGTAGAVATPIAGGLLAAIAGAVGLYVALPGMAREAAANLNLAYSGQRVLARIATDAKTAHGRPMLLCDQGSNWYQLAEYIQFAGDLEVYAADAFHRPNMPNANGTAPNPLQPARQKYLATLFKDMKDDDLVREQHRVIQTALDAGRPVYAVLQPQWVPVFQKRYMVGGYNAQQVEKWREPTPVPAEGADGALGPGGHGFVFAPGRAPQLYLMFRITHDAPTPPSTPATTPTTAPTTPPAARVSPSPFVMASEGSAPG